MMLYDWMLTQNDITALSEADRLELSSQLLSDISNSEDCWLWNGPLDSRGYGRVRLDVIPSIQAKSYKWVAVHRLIYLIKHKRIPQYSRIVHTCSEPSCCNPDHLIVEEKGR